MQRGNILNNMHRNILNDFYGLQRWHEYRTCATTKDMLHRMQCIIWFATWEQKRKIICKQGYKRVFNRFPRWEMRGGGEYTKNCVFLQKWATISLLDTWPDTRINLRDTQKSRHRCIQVLDFQGDPFFQIICFFYFSSRHLKQPWPFFSFFGYLNSAEEKGNAENIAPAFFS